MYQSTCQSASAGGLEERTLRMTASRVRFGTALARLKGVEHEGQRDLWLAQSEIHTWLGGGGVIG